MARLNHGPSRKSATSERRKDIHYAYVHKELEIPMSQSLSADIDYSLRWLIAIDIGTTHLYIRYKRPGSNEEHHVDGYDTYSQYDIDGAIVPTDLYYPIGCSRPIWGRTIQLVQKYKKNDYDPRRLVRFWKPAIHKTKGDSSYHTELKAQAVYIFGVPEISRFAKDFFNLLFDFLFHREKGYFYKSGSGFNINLASVVLSKPSGWPRSDYLTFQDSAEAWGLKGQMSFVSETDALAKSWLHHEAGKFEGLKVGFLMIVVDWGGGTVDIDALEISSFDENETEKVQVRPCGIMASSLRHGSETCLERFASHMRAKFTKSGYSANNIAEMVDAATFQFSQLKAGFELNGETSQQLLEMPGVPGDSIPLEQSDFIQVLEPSVKATTNAIDGIIAKLKISQGKLPDAIIIGGGGSAYSYFFDSLVERYERKSSSQIPVIRVQKFKRGVAMGSINLRQDMTGFLKCSLSRESYAIPCRIEDVAGTDRERMLSLYPGSKSKLNSKDGKRYFPTPVLQWFIKEGDEIGPNFVIRPDDGSGVYGMRQAEIILKEDLCFEEHLVIYRGYPGPDRWTLYDFHRTGEENYRTERLIVDLRDHIEPRALPRMNSKKGDKNRRIRLLEYDYSVEFEGETPNYFVQFKKPGDDSITKLRVHTSKIELARLEAHQSLCRDIPSSPNSSEVVSTDDVSIGCMLESDDTILSSETSSVNLALKLKRGQEQRAAQLAVNALCSNKRNMSMRRTSRRQVDTSDNDISSLLLHHNESDFSTTAADHIQETVSQRSSSPDPSQSLHRSSGPFTKYHKMPARPLQHAGRLLHKAVIDTSTVAIATKNPSSGPRTASGETDDAIASTSLKRPREESSQVHPEARSRAPLKTKSPRAPISTTAVPDRRITRKAISEALAPVSPNVRRQKVMLSGVARNGVATSTGSGRTKDSLLPVPAKRHKNAAAWISEFD